MKIFYSCEIMHYLSQQFWKCDELLHGRRLPLKLIEAVHKGYVRPAMLYGSEAWCLKESEMGILLSTERSMVRAMCRLQLKKRYMDLMFIFGLNETMDQLAKANSVHWYGHVLRREDDHIMRRALDIEIWSEEEREAEEDIEEAS